MAKKRSTPTVGARWRALCSRDGLGGRGGRWKEEAEVLRVLIQDSRTVDELAQEVVGTGGAEGFLVPKGGEGGGEN